MQRSAFVSGVATAAIAFPPAVRAQSAAIKLGAVGVEDYALGYYAQERGLFKRAGFDVELALFGGGGAASTALYAGAHRIDATVLVEPFYAESKNDVRLLGTPFDAVAKQFMITGWVANDKWLAANKAAAAQIADALRTAAHWGEHQPEGRANAARRLHQARSGRDRGVQPRAVGRKARPGAEPTGDRCDRPV